MKKKDQISPFRAKELLYDYAKGTLTEERKSAVEQNLGRDSDLKLALRGLETKLNDLKGFDLMEPSELWVQELSLPHPSLTQQIVSIERKVAPRFWKALPVAVLSLSVVMGVVLFKPWTWLKLDEVELAEVAPTDEELQMEEAIAMSEKEIEGAIQAQKQKEAAPPVEPTGSKIEFSTAANTAPTPQRTPEKKPTERKAQVGQLYRAFMTVDDLNRVTENAVAKIRNLGGKKAGQVELGWKRDDDERYFHFSMPEENKQALLDYLSNFSQVRLSNQEHPLVMPQGKIRIILVVKQNPGTAPSATPDSASPPAMAPEEIPTSEQNETSQ